MTKNLPENICSLFNDRQKRQIEENWQGMGGKKNKISCILQFTGMGNIPAETRLRSVWSYACTPMHVSLIFLLNTQSCKTVQFYSLQSKLSVNHRMTIFINSNLPIFVKFKTA